MTHLLARWPALASWWHRRQNPLPEHLRRGRAGEAAAKRWLQRAGLKFLTANFATERGEIDLIFRDHDCLVFVEVKTRSSEEWTRPARAVTHEKRDHLVKAAETYRRRLVNRWPKYRFDIVEVLMPSDGRPPEIRHLPGAFHEREVHPRR